MLSSLPEMGILILVFCSLSNARSWSQTRLDLSLIGLA